MSEGWARHLGEGKIEAFSAGTHPAASVNAFAIEVMKEKGVNLAGQFPKKLDQVSGPLDLIVAVCSQAAANCPVPPPGTAVERWDLPDPAAAIGADAQIARSLEQAVMKLRSVSGVSSVGTY
jgi:protein-tyrosine-phosphatase